MKMLRNYILLICVNICINAVERENNISIPVRITVESPVIGSCVGNYTENQKFSDVVDEIIKQYPSVKNKSLYYLYNGNVVDVNKTLAENKIKNDGHIIFYEIEEEMSKPITTCCCKKKNNPSSKKANKPSVNKDKNSTPVINNDKIYNPSKEKILVSDKKKKFIGDRKVSVMAHGSMVNLTKNIDLKEVKIVNDMFIDATFAYEIPDNVVDITTANFDASILNLPSLAVEVHLESKRYLIVCTDANSIHYSIDRPNNTESDQYYGLFSVDCLNNYGQPRGSRIKKVRILWAGGITNTAYMFGKCEDLEFLEFVDGCIGDVTDMHGMFYGCKKLRELDFKFTIKSVNDMRGMFVGCESLKSIKLSGLNFINVKCVDGMFRDCKNLESVELPKFNRSVNVSTKYMFQNCVKLRSISLGNLNFSPENTYMMFDNCTSLEVLDLKTCCGKIAYAFNELNLGKIEIKSEEDLQILC